MTSKYELNLACVGNQQNSSDYGTNTRATGHHRRLATRIEEHAHPRLCEAMVHARPRPRGSSVANIGRRSIATSDRLAGAISGVASRRRVRQVLSQTRHALQKSTIIEIHKIFYFSALGGVYATTLSK